MLRIPLRELIPEELLGRGSVPVAELASWAAEGPEENQRNALESVYIEGADELEEVESWPKADVSGALVRMIMSYSVTSRSPSKVAHIALYHHRLQVVSSAEAAEPFEQFGLEACDILSIRNRMHEAFFVRFPDPQDARPRLPKKKLLPIVNNDPRPCLTAPDEFYVTGAQQHAPAERCRRECPSDFREACLTEALEQKIDRGVWGGMTEYQRRAILRKKKALI